MGENNKLCTAYMVTDTGERIPVDLENLPEITPSETDKLADAARALSKAAEAVTVSFNVAAEAFGKRIQSVAAEAFGKRIQSVAAEAFGKRIRSVAAEVEARHEMETALRWARCCNRPLYNRYTHTKKKRTRKKYAKRILEWYRTEVAQC